MSDVSNRRPLKSRSSGWARASAAGLARIGATPDLISFLAVLFAALGCALFLQSAMFGGGGRVLCLLCAAACVQLRLVCNLLDGMVAVEHGRGSPYGPIWNELPDRIADALFLVGAGYAAAMEIPLAAPLGWLCAALAILTAYIRELGRGLGLPADFSGPMAKPQRMAVLTIAALLATAEPLWGWNGESLSIALAIIALGAAATAAGRTIRLGRQLKERAQS